MSNNSTDQQAAHINETTTGEPKLAILHDELEKLFNQQHDIGDDDILIPPFEDNLGEFQGEGPDIKVDPEFEAGFE